MFKSINIIPYYSKAKGYETILPHIKEKYAIKYGAPTISYIRLVDTDFIVEFTSFNKLYIQDIIYIYESKKLNVAKNLFLYFINISDTPFFDMSASIKEFIYYPEFAKYYSEIKKYLLWN